jgi:hypothetical protein
MQADGDVSAYEALSQHARLDDLAAAAHGFMEAAERARRAEAGSERASQIATERGLAREDAATPFGNAFDVLTRGPEDDAQRALARALAAHALRAHLPKDRDAEDREAAALLWLAAHTDFDATGLLDVALGEGATTMWDAIAERIRRIDGGQAPALGRGEALVAAIALSRSPAPAAVKLAASLANEVQDEKTAYVLGEAERASMEPIVGELAPRPRGPVAVVLLGVTGIALLVHSVRLFARLAFRLRKPARLEPSPDGGLRLRWHTEILGRTVHEGDVLVPRAGLASATRDVRYPSLPLYAGLVTLAVGTYVGVWAFVDGLRAGSPSLLATGIAIVALSLVVDFALSSLIPGARSRCRVVITPRSGTPLCVGGLDIASADALLDRLARRRSR